MSQGRVSLTIAGNPSESGCYLPRAGKSGDAAAAPRHRSAPASLTPRASLPGVWLSCPELQDGCCAPGRHSHVSFRRKEEARRRKAHTSPTLISLASTPSLGHGQGHVGTRRQTESPGESPSSPAVRERFGGFTSSPALGVLSRSHFGHSTWMCGSSQ